MNTIICCILTVAVVVGVLSSDLTPWKIVSQSDLDELHDQILKAQQAAAKAAAPEQQHGAWLWEHTYKNPLDKTTAAGHH